MQLESIRYFYEVSKCLNITQAAQQLNISQQRLSGHIQRLEEYCGISLFERKPTLQLTYAGTLLVDYAAQILGIDHDLQAIFSDLRREQSGKIRLGITATRVRISVPAIMSAFCRQYPSVQLELVNGTTAESLQKLCSNEIDVMIGIESNEFYPIDITPLMTENVYVLIPDKILNAVYDSDADKQNILNHDGILLEDFREQPFILPSPDTHLRKIVDRVLSHLNLSPKIICESGDSQIQSQLALGGFGICFLPQMMVGSLKLTDPENEGSKGNIYPLRYENTSYQIFLGLPRDRYIPQYLKTFRDIAVDVFKI